MKSFTRRDFVRTAALAAAAARAVASVRAADAPAATATSASSAQPTMRWIDGAAPSAPVGTTWGVPWPRGEHARNTSFALRSAGGDAVPVQSWPLAYWPDGSLKWTGHAIAPT